MKVKLIDGVSPRSDGIRGGPSGVTVGKIYVVAENIPSSDKYSIINDEFKMSRYSKYRFEVVDNSEVKNLRAAYNELTSPLRARIKELEKQLQFNAIKD